MINFQPGSPNQLLLNPKMGDDEKKVLAALQEKFAETFSTIDFFLIASSGSSRASNESVKLVALSRDAILNSAQRFNRYFRAAPNEAWGLVLPTFHVAGLAILARAHLVGSQVFEAKWQPEKLDEWLTQNKIAFISLVPAQVHDIVQARIKSPPLLRKVFVGAGTLNLNLRSEFIELGWPMIETYGMTETCSMIAVREAEKKFFTLLPGIKVSSAAGGLLHIQCDSLAHSTLQKRLGEIEINLFSKEGIQTEDQVCLHDEGLEFLGRASDYIKILGEGVSLAELRSKLDLIARSFHLAASSVQLLSVPDSRLENLLVLAVENSVDKELAERLFTEFNQAVRAYEKIQRLIWLEKIPLTELGKVKVSELRQVVLKNMNRRSDDKKI